MIDLDEDEKRHLDQNIAWIEANSPDDWHRVALDFNWSEPLYLLDWIVRHDQCDVATALTIFWKGEPATWMEEEGASPEEPNGYSYLNKQICKYVADRVAAGGYGRSEIAFKPTTWTKKDYVDLVAHEQTLAKPNFRTDPELIRGRSGREVDLNADFYRRYPEEFHLSYFDEQLSDDIERGAYETERSRELTRNVDEVEQRTLQALPAWLRDDAAPGRPNEPGPEILPPPTATVNADPPAYEPPDYVQSDASARVRAIRNREEPAAGDARGTENASGFAAWFKRLFGGGR